METLHNFNFRKSNMVWSKVPGSVAADHECEYSAELVHRPMIRPPEILKLKQKNYVKINEN